MKFGTVYRICPWEIAVRVGTTYRDSGGLVIDVEDYWHHPELDTPDYDISVLKLDSPLTFGPTIAAVALPVLDQPIVPGEIGQVTGWGTLSEGGSPADQLQVVEVPLMSFEDCRAAYGISAITSRMFCAGYPEGGKDACQVCV